MLILAHAGITLGAAVLINGALSKAVAQPLKKSREPTSKADARRGNPSGRVVRWVASLADRIDIRLLLVGALLPDIIDKPVGQLLFRETLSSGIIYCHTLLFLIVITAAGVIVYRRYGRTWLLAFSFGTFTHLILDKMWNYPEALLWPAYGFTFKRLVLTDWARSMWLDLLAYPEVYILEIVGGVILVLFLWVLVRNRSLPGFMRRGKVDWSQSG